MSERFEESREKITRARQDLSDGLPILKYLALRAEPVTAYELEKTKLDIMRNGKSERAWVDMPTVFAALKLLERDDLIKATEQKVCRDGRVRKRYIVTLMEC